MYDVSPAYRAEMHEHIRGELQTYVRLYLTDGRMLLFDNDLLQSTSRSSSISEISAELPSKTFTFTVDNNSHNYSVDNPNGYAPYIKEGCIVEWEYWQTIKADGSVEKIRGGTTILQTWTSDDYNATFTSVGQMDYMNTEFYYGRYSEDGESLYDLAREIFSHSKIKKYRIDPALKNIYTKNPIPADTSVNCLQLIANAGKAILYEDRDGAIVIRQNNPDEGTGTELSATAMASFANLESVQAGSTTGYASGETGYTALDGSRHFAPEGLDNLPVGFVSTTIADSNGNLSSTPTITLKFFMSTHVNRVVVDSNGEYSCVGMLSGSQVSGSTNGEVNHMVDEIRITVTSATPGQRSHVSRVYVDGGAADYSLTYRELISAPSVTGTEKVARVNVVYNEYSKQEKQLKIIFDKSELTKVVSSYSENDPINYEDLFYTFDPPDIVGNEYRGETIRDLRVVRYNLRDINEPYGGRSGRWDFVPNPEDTNLSGDINYMYSNAWTGVASRGYEREHGSSTPFRSLEIRCRNVGKYLVDFVVQVTTDRRVFEVDGGAWIGTEKNFIEGLDQFVTLNIVEKDDKHGYNELIDYRDNRKFYSPDNINALTSLTVPSGRSTVRINNPSYGYFLALQPSIPSRPLIQLEFTKFLLRPYQSREIRFTISPPGTAYDVLNDQDGRYCVAFHVTNFKITSGSGGAEDRVTWTLRPRRNNELVATIRNLSVTRDNGSYGSHKAELRAYIIDRVTKAIVSCAKAEYEVLNTWSNAKIEDTINEDYLGDAPQTFPATISDSGAFFVGVNAKTDAEIHIFGTPYNVTENIYTREISDEGVEKTVTNPLIGSRHHAQNVAKWVEAYYRSDVEYTLSYNGEPTIDCCDSIFLENLFVDENIVSITSETLDTSMGYNHGASVVARRVRAKDAGFPYLGVELDHGEVGQIIGPNIPTPTDFDISFKKTDYITVKLPENASRVDFTFWIVTGDEITGGFISPAPSQTYDTETTVVWLSPTIYDLGNKHDKRLGGYAVPWPAGQYMWGFRCWALNPGVAEFFVTQANAAGELRRMTLTVEVVRVPAVPTE